MPSSLVAQRIENEKSKSEWTSWLNKRSDKDQKSTSGRTESTSTVERQKMTGETAGGQESGSDEFGSTMEQQAMERRYPKGTKIEMTFNGEVVGYDPPNYLIRYGDQFQESFDEDDMKQYSISTATSSNCTSTEQSSSQQAAEEATEQTANQSVGAPVGEESMESATKNETEERFRRMDWELAKQKVEMDRIKKELADFQTANRSSTRQHKEEELQNRISFNERRGSRNQSTNNYSSTQKQSPQKIEHEAPSQAAVLRSPVRTASRVSRVGVRRSLHDNDNDDDDSNTKQRHKKKRVIGVNIKKET